jgi:phosphoribosyl-ATP pyrophosphohydrolase
LNTQEVIDHLIKNNKNDYNLKKLLEESIELSEVVIKMLNKSDEHKPPIEKLIEESGDVLFRLGVVLRQYKIKELVVKRTEEKSNQIAESIINNKFKGGQ